MSPIFGEVAEFETKLGLSKGFYEQLSREDDWSFVVKLNALFEAACTHALAQRLRSPEITEALSNLDVAAPKCGKIWLLRDLRAITPEQAKFLAKLAEIRNGLVHKIENVTFSFRDHVAGFDKNQRDSFVAAFGYGLNDPIAVGGKSVPRTECVLANSKLTVWIAAAEILACLHLEFAFADLHRQRLALADFGGLLAPSGNIGLGSSK